jgi:hypothetical protein
MAVGLGIVVVTLPVAALIAPRWGSYIGTHDWRIIAIAFLGAGVTLLAVVAELGRPQNPYRNLDPRFSYLDAGPPGELHSASVGWLQNAVPLALTTVVLVAWLVLD